MHTNQSHSINCHICGQDGCTEHAAHQVDAGVTSAPPAATKRAKKTGDAATQSEGKKNGKKGRLRVAPYQEGEAWSFRVRRSGLDIYETGFADEDAAQKALTELITLLGTGKSPMYGGPSKNTVAKCLQRYALETLPGLKGAAQAVRRINRWLKALALPEVAILPLSEADKAPKNTQVWKGRYWAAFLVPATREAKIPRGLEQYRAALVSKSADSARVRQVLAAKEAAKLTSVDLQRYVQVLEAEGLARATVGQEQALLRGMFNHAIERWHWKSIDENPARTLKLTGELVERETVLEEEDEQRLDAAAAECRAHAMKPAFKLLRETGMRASEPRHARWGDVNWDKCILTLHETKDPKGARSRQVPLSPGALGALRELGPSDDPEAKIFAMTYDSLKAAWRRVCERAGIKDLRIQDLRHTAATRMALKSGNIFLVQALTGHKTLKMVERYVNVKAKDVVKVMHAPEAPVPAAPAATVSARPEAAADAQALMTQLASLSAQLSAQLAAASESKSQQPAIGDVTQGRLDAANEPQTKGPETRTHGNG